MQAWLSHECAGVQAVPSTMRYIHAQATTPGAGAWQVRDESVRCEKVDESESVEDQSGAGAARLQGEWAGDKQYERALQFTADV